LQSIRRKDASGGSERAGGSNAGVFVSIAQKGSTTWLPRFWRKSGSVPLDDQPSVQEGPLDDRPPVKPVMNDVADTLDRVRERKAETPGIVEPARIHALACVDRSAVIEDGVEVGPFCVVGPNVRIGRGTKLMNNVTIIGHTTLGQNNLVFPNAVLGGQPQDKKFGGEATRLEIGDNNHFREAVTIHTGTGKGGGLTKIGSGNLLMVNTHIGHDVIMGNNCIFANNVMLAGHVHVGNCVVLSGCVGIHHFVTVGDYAYSAGMCKLTHDVAPYVKVDEKDRVRGTNSIGLRRNGFSENDVKAIEEVVWTLFLDKDREPVNPTLRKIRSGSLLPDLSGNVHVNNLVSFLERRNLGRHGRYLESLRAG
jgi:UDP-N-acetylglucosamine acyltransferase